ncbi:MAG TPA: phosphoethanolamine--lipid A transferase [Gammaproteobacteria bacterium]|nr:phosphoethanolamine--lipid A transferase [Gammaproteobacteria bacterium]
MSITPTRLILLVAAFLILVANFSFFDKVTDVYPFTTENIVFLFSLGILFFALIALLTIIFSIVIPVRLVVSIFIILAALTSYYADNLGTVIDTDMIRNVLETNMSEASDLINTGFVLHLILTAILPVIVVWRLPFRTSGLLRETRYKLQMAVALVILIVINILPLSDYYSSFFREHKTLRYYSNPGYPIYSMGKYLSQKIRSSTLPEYITLAKHVEQSGSDDTQRLIILIVGETARSDHFSLNGYTRETNPKLSAEDRLISYSNIASCGTSTAISVPCMFAFDDRKEFDADEARHTENILDILKRAGVHVLWLDNNSSSKGVAARVTHKDYRSPELNPDCDIECRDTGMLAHLQEYIDSNAGDKLVVLHQMGSHGPAYYKRYPEEFERFKPACQSAELSECSTQEIINAYDNTILYTDHFLSRVIAFLKQNTPEYRTAMLYLSDHGESLGEAGIFLHGLPYLFAPDAQTEVPVIAWIGSSSDIDYDKTLALRTVENSHDALFSTLLEAFSVLTELHHPEDRPLIVMEQDL